MKNNKKRGARKKSEESKGVVLIGSGAHRRFRGDINSPFLLRTVNQFNIH